MKMFGNLTTAGKEESGDRLGGSSIFDSGIYTGKVKLAYAGKSAGGAQSMTVLIAVGSREYRETFYITNKAGENFYPDKQDPTKKQLLPGFTSIDELCLLTTGESLSEQSVEEKVVSIYDFDAKKDVPTNVPVLVDVIGKDITFGVIKQTVDKQSKDSNGVYKNTGDTRDENVIDKFFHTESGRTVTEFKAEIDEAVFQGKWKEKNTGVTRMRAKGSEGKSGAPGSAKTGGTMFASGAGSAVAGAPAKTKLFG